MPTRCPRRPAGNGRRRPAPWPADTHRAFDEATAILAADGLQALAFEVLADTAQSAGTCRLSGNAHPPGARRRLRRHGRRPGDRPRLGRRGPRPGGPGSHAPAQDRRADRSQRAPRRPRQRSRRACRAGRPGGATPRRSAWPSRCRTTSSTWKATPPPSARPRAWTRRTTSRPIPPCSAWRPPKAMPWSCATRSLAALDGFPPSADPLRQLARYIVERRN